MKPIQIGNPKGRIALHLDETEAIDLAYMYGLNDSIARDLLDAVERAYPSEIEDEGTRLGLYIVLESRDGTKLIM